MSKRIYLTVVIAVLLLFFGGIALYVFRGTPSAEVMANKDETEKIPVKVLIVPKFEIGDIDGDYPGEAQLFYEHYCAGCEEIAVPNTSPTSKFYFNTENGVGLLLTGSGKMAAALSLMSLLSWNSYDFSDTKIVSVGCSGGSTGSCIYGDVVLVTTACDLELGHHTGKEELADPENGLTWFPDEDSNNEYICKQLNKELYEKAYQLIKDCPLRTTEETKQVIEQNFPDEAWANRDPQVLRGTAITADSYWKGAEDHRNAVAVADHYECSDDYAVTEMEEVAVMNTAECFDLQNQVISLRVVVNLDTFLKDESPEQLWLDDSDYASSVVEDNSETLDIFEPGMENLFDTGKIVIDAILAGEL